MIIETERLILRPPEAADFPAFHAHRSDLESSRFLGGPLPEAVAWRQFGHMIVCGQLGEPCPFSVLLKATGAWIGLVGPWRLYGWPDDEFRYEIAASHQRQGFAREAALAVLTHLFGEGHFEMRFHIHPDNAASRRLAFSLGARSLGLGHAPRPFEHQICEVFVCRAGDLCVFEIAAVAHRA